MNLEFPLRLQVYLAKSGQGSRRSSEELIKSGRVMVNNKVVTEMGHKVEKDDVVQVDGDTIDIIERTYYFALNKPKGYVCTNYDPNEQLYARDLIHIRDNSLLFNVGRLDKESTGIILFTNDGEFAQKVTHPSFEIEKEYMVKLDRNVQKEDLHQALKGIYIDQKLPYRIKSFEMQTKTWVKVILTEGKNREIRKIFTYLGYEVKQLIRVRIGCILLDDLTPGKYRQLTNKEINGLLMGKTTLVERKKFGKAALKKTDTK